MLAEAITIGVFPLDQVRTPRPGAGTGWAAALAGALPQLKADAMPVALSVRFDPAQLVLAAKSGRHAIGSPLAIEPVPGAPLFLVRLGGKAFGVAFSSCAHPGLSPAANDRPADPAALAAFAAGTGIDTPDGPRAAQSLRPGDLVTTLANGSRPLAWVGRRQVSALELLGHPGLRPVGLAPGVAGNDRMLWLSPRQRLLIDDWRAEVLFGEDRVLAPAEALVNGDTVRQSVPPNGTEFVLLVCDRHEILLADGALCESFHPGDSGLDGLTGADRAALAQVIPEADLIRRRAAFPIVRGAEARALRLPG